MITRAAPALVLALFLPACSGGNCSNIYIAPLIVSVVDDKTGVDVCGADVVVTDESGKTVPHDSPGADAGPPCGFSVAVAKPGTLLVRVTWSGRTAQSTVVIPKFGSCGPEMTVTALVRV